MGKHVKNGEEFKRDGLWWISAGSCAGSEESFLTCVCVVAVASPQAASLVIEFSCIRQHHESRQLSPTLQEDG